MDYIITKWFNSFAGQSDWFDVLWIVLADYLIFAIPLIIVLVYFLSKRRKKIGLILLKIVLAFGLACLMNYLVSLIFLRPRPFVNNREIYQLAKLFAKPTDFSFPSYHTAAAFVLALSVLLDWKKFGIILLVLAAIIGFSRILVGVHYPTDILGGIATALISVFLIKEFSQKFQVLNQSKDAEIFVRKLL